MLSTFAFLVISYLYYLHIFHKINNRCKHSIELLSFSNISSLIIKFISIKGLALLSYFLFPFVPYTLQHYFVDGLSSAFKMGQSIYIKSMTRRFRMCKPLQNQLRYLIYVCTSRYEDEGKIAS